MQISLPNVNGDEITRRLRAFNEWRDEFVIELATPMLMLGFVAGTISLFTSQIDLTATPWFSLAWSIVQAVAIDGLFFSVWSRISRLEWGRATWFHNVALVFIGLLLAIVASLVNNVVTYQEVNHISSVAKVMTTLGIDQATFSYGRSTLVVAISILVALVGNGRELSPKELRAMVAHLTQELQAMIDRHTNELQAMVARHEEEKRATATGYQTQITELQGELRATLDRCEVEKWAFKEQHKNERETLKADYLAQLAGLQEEAQATIAELQAELEATKEKLTRLRKRNAVALPDSSKPAKASPNEQAMSYELRATEQATDYELRARIDQATGYVAADDGATIAIANGDGQAMIATGSHRDRIKQAMLQALQEGREMSYQDIAQIAQVGYSTVKKYAQQIRQELALLPRSEV